MAPFLSGFLLPDRPTHPSIPQLPRPLLPLAAADAARSAGGDLPACPQPLPRRPAHRAALVQVRPSPAGSPTRRPCRVPLPSFAALSPCCCACARASLCGPQACMLGLVWPLPCNHGSAVLQGNHLRAPLRECLGARMCVAGRPGTSTAACMRFTSSGLSWPRRSGPSTLPRPRRGGTPPLGSAWQRLGWVQAQAPGCVGPTGTWWRWVGGWPGGWLGEGGREGGREGREACAPAEGYLGHKPCCPLLWASRACGSGACGCSGTHRWHWMLCWARGALLGQAVVQARRLAPARAGTRASWPGLWRVQDPATGKLLTEDELAPNIATFLVAGGWAHAGLPCAMVPAQGMAWATAWGQAGSSGS
jgi:hypothetical protein